MPGTDVVARQVTRSHQKVRSDGGAATRVAVGDDLGAFRQSEEGLNRGGVARSEKIVEVHMPRSADVTLTRVAWVPRRAVVLGERSNVEQREPLFAEARRYLVPRDVGHSAAMTSSSA